MSGFACGLTIVLQITYHQVMNDPVSQPLITPREADVDYAGLITDSADDHKKTSLVSRWLLHEFDIYYDEWKAIPAIAKCAFERGQYKLSLTSSRRRLSIYSISIGIVGSQLKQVFPALAEDESLWERVEALYLPMIELRYEADLAYAYIHSIRRRVYLGEWKPVEYSFGEARVHRGHARDHFYARYTGHEEVTVQTVCEILALPGLSVGYANMQRDASLIAKVINSHLAAHKLPGSELVSVEVIKSGFYRNRGCYIVGRVVLSLQPPMPLILALLIRDGDVYVDAVLKSEDDAHNLFSSTLANFHVDSSYYHELSEFLHSFMPTRPLGLHYSTIGVNHIGKVAVMSELERELAETGEVLTTAVGAPGTVAMGFSIPSSAYNLKVIRDHPTAGYKWGVFEGVESVLKKYARVHEINRTGSMLDNIIYYNLKLAKDWFDPVLLEELLSEAGDAVSLQGDAVILKHMIVQRRQTPLPVFLENASPQAAENAVINLGYCIKNNAAANIFNRDLDGRNYGVSSFGKVYLYDYDAVEPFTDVKIRTNTDRIYGEEDIPDWYFEDGIVFLPEEIEVGLRIPDRGLRRRFREVHGDLMHTEYWQGLQDSLRSGQVPSVRVYSEHCELKHLRDC